MAEVLIRSRKEREARERAAKRGIQPGVGAMVARTKEWSGPQIGSQEIGCDE